MIVQLPVSPATTGPAGVIQARPTYRGSVSIGISPLGPDGGVPAQVRGKCILRRPTTWRGGRVGRRQPPAKRLQGQNLCPGFESRPLRHSNSRPLGRIERRTANRTQSGARPERGVSVLSCTSGLLLLLL